MHVHFKPSFFALKCFDRDIKFGKINANMIFISDKCNFKCRFCRHSKYKLENFKSKNIANKSIRLKKKI